MKTNPIDSIFNSMRELPVEIPVHSIEQFILQQPAVVFTPKHFLFNSKIIIMTSITAIITTTLLIVNTHRTTPAIEQTPLAPVTENNIPAPDTLAETPATTITTHRPVQLIFTPAAVDSSKKKSTQTAVIINSDSSTNTVTIYSSGNNSVSISEGNGYSYSGASSGNNSAVAIYSDKDASSVQSGNVTFDNRNCDKGDAFEKIIEQTLLNDGLITSAKKYAYALTDQEFSVNGKTQPEEMRKKYLALLLDNSCITFEGTFSFAYDKSKSTVTISTSTGE